VAVGVIIGCVGGAIGFQPLLGLLLKSMGIGLVLLDTPPLILLGLGTGLVVFAAGVIVVVARSVRKVDVHQLISQA
jgi:hypothetical protein